MIVSNKIGLIVIAVVAMIMTCGFSVAQTPGDALVGAWLFDDASGKVSKDASGNGHDGDVLGPTWGQGIYNGALNFDGEDDIVEIPYNAAFDLATFTIMAWVNVPEPKTNVQTILGKGVLGAGSPRNYGLYIYTNGTLGCNYTSGGGWQDTKANTVIADGEWHHAAFTYDGIALHMYMDGKLDGEKATTNVPDQPQEPVRIGRWAGDAGDFINGAVDEVAIFNKALSEEEIQSAMVGLAITFGFAVEPSGKLATTWSHIKGR